MIRVENLTVAYGAFKALTDISVDLGQRGQVHSIIGPNGAGKSTFMDAIVGKRRPSAGRIFYKDRDISRETIQWRRKNGMARSFQKTSIFPGLTIFEQLDLVASHLNEPDLDAIIDTMDLREVLNVEATRAAYGVQRRVDVALGLIGMPDILLLDEPGAGLSAEETAHLFRHLRKLASERNIAAVVVEHDVEAVFALSDVVTVLDLGRHLATGTPAEIRANPQVVAAYLGTAA
ncbi:ABC transporter ATP-binding protein [Paracoccus sp. FO-3]|uniref:ABC transporter ATP-binding protein n=1 Tax=Paracoccus sp. FO-3 TaxID=1335059 RepID=UPI0011265C6B|nr:ATP-binding cassette domain-containing protein [Paracoccus sp. FO-3]